MPFHANVAMASHAWSNDDAWFGAGSARSESKERPREKRNKTCHHGDLSQQSQAEMSEGGMFRIPFTATRVQETLAEHQQRVDQEDLELELTFWSCTHFKLLDTVVVSPFLKCKSSAAESLQSLGQLVDQFLTGDVEFGGFAVMLWPVLIEMGLPVHEGHVFKGDAHVPWWTSWVCSLRVRSF